ncbi:MAG: 16S rRNA (adenine(1518)-N(6)/adenine(1519)-N(6))-dimethyltransferase RsmA [Candidatus Nanohaloarchaea archaeon]
MNVQEKLRELGIKPVEGQNFLTSETIIKALVEAGEAENETVLEIGAGTGSITEELSEKAGKVYALEPDTVLYRHLVERFGDSDVELVNDDFLSYEIPEDVTRCVSNLPFQISSDAIEKLGENQVQSSLILQEELGDKIVAEPGDSRYGPLTVKANYYFIPVKLQTVPRRHYYPEPEVDTCIVKLYPNRERHGVEDEELFFKLSRALFTHKRKKVRNAFVDARHILGMEKDEAKELRDDLPHSEERVIDLEIIQIKEIADFAAGEL